MNDENVGGGNLEEVPQPKSDVAQVAREVLAGHWSRGHRRTAKLKEAGYDPKAVQKEVDRLLGR